MTLKSSIDEISFGDIKPGHLKKEYIEQLQDTFGKEGFKKFLPFVLGSAHIKFKERQQKLNGLNPKRRKKLFKERDTMGVRFSCNPELAKMHKTLEDGNAIYFIITINECLKELVDNLSRIGAFTSEVDREYEKLFGFKISKL